MKILVFLYNYKKGVDKMNKRKLVIIEGAIASGK